MTREAMEYKSSFQNILTWRLRCKALYNYAFCIANTILRATKPANTRLEIDIMGHLCYRRSDWCFV